MTFDTYSWAPALKTAYGPLSGLLRQKQRRLLQGLRWGENKQNRPHGTWLKKTTL